MVRLAQVELERLGMEGLSDGFQQFVGDFPLDAEDQDGELTTGTMLMPASPRADPTMPSAPGASE